MPSAQPPVSWVGTSGFQYPEWKGTFYPEDLPLKKMLPYYAERFSTTEINYSFRRIPAPSTLENWSRATPAKFRFSLKAPQKVTHFAKLHDCRDTMHYFHTVIGGLGGKLGPVLFQLPPSFKKDVALLAAFLRDLPPKFRGAFEFRHESWFDDAVFAELRAHNIALCIAENEDLATPQVITADYAYFRLRREDYQSADLKRWADFVRQTSNVPEAFIYFKHEESGMGPKFAQTFLELLGA